MWQTSFQGACSTLRFGDKWKRYSPIFFQGTDLLQTHVYRTQQLKYSSAELWNPEWIQQTDENPGQNSPKLKKCLNLDQLVWTQALALISLERVTGAAEYLTAPCSKAACLKAGATLLKREPAPKGPRSTARQTGRAPLPSGRRETSTSYSKHGNTNLNLQAMQHAIDSHSNQQLTEQLPLLLGVHLSHTAFQETLLNPIVKTPLGWVLSQTREHFGS